MLAFLREVIEPPILLVVYLKNRTMFDNLLALNTMRCRACPEHHAVQGGDGYQSTQPLFQI